MATRLNGTRRGSSGGLSTLLPPSLVLRLGLLLLALMAIVRPAYGFQVAVTDADPLRQTCSGMWKGEKTRIDLTFDKTSAGTVSTLFYEFSDFDKVGKEGRERDIFGFPLKTYICTTQAVLDKLCTDADLGNFIVASNASSIVTKRVDLSGAGAANSNVVTYNVTRKGYYCVGATAVPMTTSAANAGDLHSHFTARINFVNFFDGQLPATEYPKLQFYFTLTALYMLLGAYWLYLCISHRDELLTVQHFISGTIILLIIGNAAQWLYYRYLNTHTMDFWRIASLDGNSAVTFGARALLVLTSVLDAARNSVSLFLLLIVSMGYGVVRPTIGPVMTRVRILTAVHFVCGVLYSIGIVLIVTETGGGWIFLFIFPLAFTLTSFMMWTLHSLNATIEYLTQRKQSFKGLMFRRLYRILLCAVVAIFAFFVITSIAFSQSSAENFSPNVWSYRWFLLDGWMGTLYLTVFGSIAWLWRPTGQNLRLSMSDEVGQDEGFDGEDFEIGEFGQHGGPDDDDEEAGATKRTSAAATASNGEATAGSATGRHSASAQGRSTGGGGVGDDDVVFEIGDDDEEGQTPRKQHQHRETRDTLDGTMGEREGLMTHEAENDSRDTLVPSQSQRKQQDGQ